MIKVLIIGNSFGQDAARYLNGISRAGGEEITVVNLYIGGCTLERHFRNMHSEEAAYAYEVNGIETNINISLKSALLLNRWDYVVFQQCSNKSGEYDTYQPYLSELSAYVRRLCPKAKQGMYLTWAYARTSPRFGITPFSTPEEMLPAIVDAYTRAADAIGADFIIPAGKAMWELYQAIGDETFRDGYHADKRWTRLMLGYVWFIAFTGRSVLGNTFRDFDGGIPEDRVALVQSIAESVMRK